MSVTNKRIEYIDALRGFTMILVVYSHLCVFALSGYKSVINDVLHMMRMPLFFFVSGFVGYAIYTRELFVKRFTNRVRGQLVPTVVVGSLYVWVMGRSFMDSVMSEVKSGYWFTLVLFEIYAVYAILSYLLDRGGYGRNVKTVVYAMLIVLAQVVVQWLYSLETRPQIVSLFSFLSFTHFFKYFFFGVIAKMWMDKYDAMIQNGYVMSVVLIAFAVLTYSCFEIRELQDVYGILAILVVYRFFQKYEFIFNANTFLGGHLSYIGRHTLEIYLIHYFLINGLKDIFLFPGTNFFMKNRLMEMIMVLSYSIIIVYLSILVSKVIKMAPPLYTLMFGPVRKTSKK